MVSSYWLFCRLAAITARQAGISGSPGCTFFPEFKVELGVGYSLLNFLPDTLQFSLHFYWHHLIRVRRKASQNPLALRIIGKAGNDFIPKWPERPTPTAHGIVEVVKLTLHGLTSVIAEFWFGSLFWDCLFVESIQCWHMDCSSLTIMTWLITLMKDFGTNCQGEKNRIQRKTKRKVNKWIPG